MANYMFTQSQSDDGAYWIDTCGDEFVETLEVACYHFPTRQEHVAAWLDYTADEMDRADETIELF